MLNFLSLLGVLAMVLLILVLAWYATRWIAAHSVPGLTGPLQPGGDGRLSLLAQLSVGRNERVVVVRAGERCYLLGVTEHGMSLLRELESDEAESWLRPPQGAAGAPRSFADTLRETLRRK